MRKSVTVIYYALLREERGLSTEKILTDARTVQELYLDLKAKHNFRLNVDLLRVAINNEFQSWETKLKNFDSIVFIPPVAGG